MKACFATLLALPVLSLSVAQSGPHLYDGARTAQSQQISLRPWGNGRISETKEQSFSGTQSVKVSSQNYFQGGTLNFNSPRDFAKEFDDKTNAIRVTFILGDSILVTGTTDKNKGKGSLNTGVTVTGRAVSFNPSKPGELTVTPSIPFKPKIKKVRMVVATTDGKRSEVYVPIYSTVGLGGGWRAMAVPLHAITGFERTNKMVQSLTLSTDTTSTFYVGDLGLISDTTPVGGVIESAPLTLKAGARATLTASGEGGNTPLVYAWDFDDRDGLQTEAEGNSVAHSFRKVGTFIITVTISDYYGIKESVKQTLRVKVTA